MKLFVSPHNDDAVLFGCFTLQRESPLVLTVFDSYVQYNRGNLECGAAARRREDENAIRGVLGLGVTFAGIPDDDGPGVYWPKVNLALQKYSPEEVWFPAREEGGHAHHNAVHDMCSALFGECSRVHKYLTYTVRGKSTNGSPVPFTGYMLRKKLEALTCYRTQLDIDSLGCAEHFCRDQREYVAQ